MSEIVLLNSGGLDSALMAAKYAADGENLHSLYIATRQLNEVSAKVAAQETANRFCVSHDDNTTVLKTWSVNETTLTRSQAT